MEMFDNFKRFEFFSQGPKGKIRKVVKFQQFDSENIYNLAFGDLDEISGIIDFDSRSNNSDRDKVMATVAATVYEFMAVYSNAVVFVEGGTDAKTRLYQMGISKHLSEINLRYVIRGWNGNRWEPFEKGKNYESFSLGRGRFLI